MTINKYINWNHRDDKKTELKVDVIILLVETITKDEVFKTIFDDTENFKKCRGDLL